IEYFIFDSLGKENPNNVIGLIEKCMDMYWITRLYYVVKSTNAGIIKNRNGKIEENKNNEIK
ncbi:MAG: hypothetical protein NZ903_02190, partial [Candidatus Micrarchaeota archaeon]|nr:hypothetical protein [Candidatus Micrarchaeota archaeon]